ncbi:aldo/keto reductase [Streptomyces sp. DR7-3]|uniref:aldo/keto reductase n=1 Tax=Streptomyces malaysiensis TaxID=92644 RepID=UPI002043F7F6|nr:aldo/keto reductase [Streptomyces sp. DR7-3]MCM3807373.1 aldo/keto reductase [Streptomyces sp. DR7-3]
MPLDSYVTLPRCGLRVSPLTLGTMTFGDDAGWGTGEEESTTILAHYLELGGNSVDTANIYTNGHSEKIIGDFFAGRNALRDRTVIGTKFFGNLHLGDPNGGGTGRKALHRQLEESLRRLRMDYVDILWIHNWDQGTPVEETLRALDDLVSAGKIRYVGFSDLPAWKAAEAQTIALLRGWSPAVALQIEYSLIERTGEGELLPFARSAGLAVMPWSPLRRGVLSGKYTRDNRDRPRDDGLPAPDDRELDIVETLLRVAAETGATPAATALAWVASRPGVSSTIIGARRPSQFEDNIAALDVQLTDDQLAALDRASAPSLNFPAENNTMLAPMLQYAGATVDGQDHVPFPQLTASSTRY